MNILPNSNLTLENLLVQPLRKPRLCPFQPLKSASRIKHVMPRELFFRPLNLAVHDLARCRESFGRR
jgi:hypothetical protein